MSFEAALVKYLVGKLAAPGPSLTLTPGVATITFATPHQRQTGDIVRLVLTDDPALPWPANRIVYARVIDATRLTLHASEADTQTNTAPLVPTANTTGTLGRTLARKVYDHRVNLLKNEQLPAISIYTLNERQAEAHNERTTTQMLEVVISLILASNDSYPALVRSMTQEVLRILPTHLDGLHRQLRTTAYRFVYRGFETQFDEESAHIQVCRELHYDVCYDYVQSDGIYDGDDPLALLRLGIGLDYSTPENPLGDGVYEFVREIDPSIPLIL